MPRVKTFFFIPPDFRSILIKCRIYGMYQNRFNLFATLGRGRGGERDCQPFRAAPAIHRGRNEVARANPPIWVSAKSRRQRRSDVIYLPFHFSNVGTADQVSAINHEIYSGDRRIAPRSLPVVTFNAPH